MKKILLLAVAAFSLVTAHAQNYRFYNQNGGYQGQATSDFNGGFRFYNQNGGYRFYNQNGGYQGRLGH